MSSPDPPGDPEYHSNAKELSPVSPKPLHIPIPSNIPVLQKQIDPDFNQMDTHLDASKGAPQEAAEPVFADVMDDGQIVEQDMTDVSPVEEIVSGNAEDASSNDAPPTETPTATAVEAPQLTQPIPEPVLSSSSHALPDQTESDVVNGDTAIPEVSATPTAIPTPDYSALVKSLTTAPLPTTSAPAPSFILLDGSDPGATNLPTASAAGLPARPPAQAVAPASLPATGDASQYPGSLAHGATGANGLPPPPMASFQQRSSGAPNPAPDGHHRSGRHSMDSIVFDGEEKWGPEIQKEYEAFLDTERHFVTEGNWEQFPMGSRLFVGNLSSERVTKRDVFHVFHKYGKLAQISIKQAYGFVQFLSDGDCRRALDGEQGQPIRGKKINLEISKPQKNRAGVTNNKRRSKSPERAFTGGRRGRDDYRPGRSPSPSRGYRDRSRDRYGRRRSRSRSPYGRGGRYRSPSPRRDQDDDLPLPKRNLRDVPDVQVIVMDNLDPGFVQWVEKSISACGVKTDALLLRPRLSEAAVIRRQIIEGVTAVVKLTRASQAIGKIPLQVFDRTGGSDVKFEEYVDLDPGTAGQVVLRAKANNQPTYGYGYGATTQQSPTFPPPGSNPNLSSAISSLGPAELQRLLASMQQPGQQQSHSFGQQHQQHQQPSAPMASLMSNPALAGLLGGQAGSSQQQRQPGGQSAVAAIPPQNMADILSKLSTYRP